MSSPLVSCIVPTLDRADRHADLYACFDSQTYEPKELLVFDGSKRISPFFSSLADARVRYEHTHRPKGEVTRIGAERNALLELAQGDFCQHLDDDDFYAPEFLSSMMARIGDAALAKLGVWNAIQESSGSIWQWDVTAMGGKHFAVVGAETPIETDVPSDGGDERIAEVFRVGYGFSYFYPRSTWEEQPFPEEGTEDVPWTRALIAAGKRVVQVMDCAHLCLHTVHPQSESVIYPQRRIGASSGLTELPRGKAIPVRPGRTYAILASVKDKHSLKGLAVRAGSWGMNVTAAQDNVAPSQYGVGAPPGGYRLVYVTGDVKAPSSIPWSVPAPLNVFDKTSIVRAWASAPPPPPKTPRVVSGLPPRLVLTRRR